jgi:DNA-binding NarL/FixJ family response regulator
MLTLSENTVKNHVKSILAKLNAKDRTHAVTEALKRGLFQLGRGN